jgi:hypothetical protein
MGNTANGAMIIATSRPNKNYKVHPRMATNSKTLTYGWIGQVTTMSTLQGTGRRQYAPSHMQASKNAGNTTKNCASSGKESARPWK